VLYKTCERAKKKDGLKKGKKKRDSGHVGISRKRDVRSNPKKTITGRKGVKAMTDLQQNGKGGLPTGGRRGKTVPNESRKNCQKGRVANEIIKFGGEGVWGKKNVNEGKKSMRKNNDNTGNSKGTQTVQHYGGLNGGKNQTSQKETKKKQIKDGGNSESSKCFQ